MSQPSLELLAEYRQEMGIEVYAVLLYLLGKLDFENHLVVNQSELAKKLGMRQPHISRSLKRLVALEVLIDGPKAGSLRTYRLNPSFGWKGSAKNHQNMVKLDQKKKTSKTSKKED
jgi:DNA-binding IclR family transcriptional regulator